MLGPPVTGRWLEAIERPGQVKDSVQECRLNSVWNLRTGKTSQHQSIYTVTVYVNTCKSTYYFYAIAIDTSSLLSWAEILLTSLAFVFPHEW
jgi:hypothetical protein